MPDKKENFCYAPMQKNYMMAAEKLLPKKRRVHSDYRHSLMVRADVSGYNFAREEDLPIVADLLKHIDELKNRGAK